MKHFQDIKGFGVLSQVQDPFIRRGLMIMDQKYFIKEVPFEVSRFG